MNMGESKYQCLATLFRTLGDPACLQVLQELRRSAQEAESENPWEDRPPGSLSVSEVSRRTQLPLSTTSGRLKALRSAGLIRTRRSGHAILCWINPEPLAILEGFFKEEAV